MCHVFLARVVILLNSVIEIINFEILKIFLQQITGYFFHKTLKNGIYEVSVHMKPCKFANFRS